jgi:sec-independent protein translocase protein TatB
MSLPDTIFILLAALLLFGPKKLPEIARQVGKLMAELRRASNEFKFQMEDELRQADEAERRKKAEAAAAATSAAVASTTTTAAPTLPAPTPVTLELPSTGAPIANHVSPHAADVSASDLLPSAVEPAAATTNAEPVTLATPDLAPPVLAPPVLTPKGDA